MPKIIISFDVEDFITPETDDILLSLMDILAETEITASFNLVAEKLRVLESRGRVDVLERLLRHEINYHSNYHSIPPTIAEYLNNLDWEKGLDQLQEKEAPGVDEIRRLCGQTPYANVAPGNSWAPQYLYAQSVWGVPIFVDCFNNLRGNPVWYCNTLNVSYDIQFDDPGLADETRLEQLKRQVELLYAQRGPDQFITLYLHPCTLVTKNFWDAHVNFTNGKNTPRSRWKPARLRAEAETDRLLSEFRELICFIKSLPEVHFATFKDMYRNYRNQTAVSVKESAILQIAEQVAEELTYFEAGEQFISPAEIFSLLVRYAVLALSGKNTADQEFQIEPIIGPTAEIPLLTSSVTISRKQLVSGCRELRRYCYAHNSVPSSIKSGPIVCDPGSFIQSLAKVLIKLEKNGPVDEPIIIHPGQRYPTINNDEFFDKLTFTGSWDVFPEDFKGENIVHLAKLQTWSFKPASLTTAAQKEAISYRKQTVSTP